MSRFSKFPPLAFTLIELLIVVAIIAILAAIAVPNFLEAQVRSKISRCRADMRTVSLAIESYTIDNNRPPIGKNEGKKAPLTLWDDNTSDWVYNRMTTPVSYLSSVPQDPFNVGIVLTNVSQNNKIKEFKSYEYQTTKWTAAALFKQGFTWYLRGTGPDKVVGAPYLSAMVSNHDSSNIYDATNGTTSYGDIHRTNKGDFTNLN